MTIIRRYLLDFTADVFRQARLRFSTTVEGDDLDPPLTPSIPIEQFGELRQLLATRAELEEGQPAGSVDQNQVQLVSAVLINAKLEV